MAAPARAVPVLPARVPARRTMPRRRPATRRRPGTRQHSGLRLIGKSAHAVTHFPESGLVRTAATGRRWIFVIGALLLAIVAINVVTVSYGSMASKIETQIESIERQNAILKSSETAALAMPRVQAQAESEGMYLPEPDEIHYRSFQPGDYAAAAERLAAGG
ncbi:MAG: hypothetical protein J0H66_02705 [Solirubrobacterales bacterium]|nr:hypothetical protein [Solirubrobacterales bacterium]MBN9166375.1 hypothetical protein [Myxococcales bacterium]OJU95255.1 MAG: hypothetical protein BGO23_05175 [Solirubrobacterales bacterium 67-14]